MHKKQNNLTFNINIQNIIYHCIDFSPQIHNLFLKRKKNPNPYTDNDFFVFLNLLNFPHN